MLEAFMEFFRQLAEDAPRWNFIFFYEERQWLRIVSGIKYTLLLSVACVIFSVIIGVVGAWLQGAKSKFVRRSVQGYNPIFPQHPSLRTTSLLLFCTRPVHPNNSGR